MSIYLLAQIITFVICALLSICPTNKCNKIAVLLSIILNFAGLIFFGVELADLKDNHIWTGGFNIPTLQYSLFVLPILVLFNFLSLLYLFSFYSSNNIQSNILIVSLFNLHNFLLTVLVFVRELVVLFFVLEFISLVNIGFILSSNSPNRKEVAIKYFIQNMVAGILYIVGVIFFYKNTATLELIPFIEQSYSPKRFEGIFANLQYFLFCLFFFKLGIFPFHSWVSDVFQILDKNLYVALFAFQKSILFFVTGQFFYIFSTYRVSQEFIYTMSTVLFLTVLISVSGGIFSKNLKRFLGYSSIYNAIFYIGLPLSFIFNAHNRYTTYFFYMYLFVTFYIVSTYVVFTLINAFELENFSDIGRLSGIYKLIWLFFIVNFLPFPFTLGFFAKVGVLIEIFLNRLYNIGIILAVSSIFALYIYTRLILPLSLTAAINSSDKGEVRGASYIIVSSTILYILLNLLIVLMYKFVVKLI